MRWPIPLTGEFVGVWIPGEFVGVWIPVHALADSSHRRVRGCLDSWIPGEFVGVWIPVSPTHDGRLDSGALSDRLEAQRGRVHALADSSHRRVRGCLLYMPDVRLFCGHEISVDSSPELSVRRFETLLPATNEPMEGFVGTPANRQQNFDFSKQISQTIFQTAGVSVDALTSHFQFCGEGDSSGSWSAGSTDRRIVVFPPIKGARTAFANA